jgi:hypothetical protein
MYEYGTLKPVKVILRRGMARRENNGGDETNQGTLYVYMKASQQNLCTTIITQLIKTLKERSSCFLKCVQF